MPKSKEKKKKAESEKKEIKKRAGNGIQDLTLASLQRILYRSNVHRASKTVYSDMRDVLNSYLSTLLSKMVLFTAYENRRTIYSKDLKETMESMGVPLFASHPDILKKKKKNEDEKKPEKADQKKHRAKQGVIANRKIKELQQSEEFCFPRTVFERIVRHITKEHESSVKFSSKVFYLLQVVAELYLINLCKQANESAKQQKRETLFSEDIQFILKIRSM